VLTLDLAERTACVSWGEKPQIARDVPTLAAR
jgi:hypothetical protein